ncbi:hypothetical protein QN224_06865 [Sinorhizobium sp. 8-89]|uniref:hypothetical protein n=1 Tax=Sinorhizobium sp. 7-81 TaxID=3049087 RepID=UPI0024C331C2|nr:hypothetical protein [Sinorhizobium sp. 7-81]MDK1385125.1 hypothetical protein [Sinorhizobium sp. 7-81]
MTTSKRPGYHYRLKKDGSTAHYWDPKRAVKGAPAYLKLVRLNDDLTDVELAEQCRRHTEELRKELDNLPAPSAYDGTIRSLIKLYRTDKTSGFQAVKHSTRSRDYNPNLQLLEDNVGERSIDKLKRSDFKRWFEKWKEKSHSRAVGAIKLLRIILSYGTGERLHGCSAAREILSLMKFEQPPRREIYMTFKQCRAIVRASRKLGFPSIGFVEALKFETALRRIDVIGEWNPPKDGGPFEWTGLCRDSISDDLILSIKTTKTKSATSHDLKVLPLVKEALKSYPLPLKGPVVIDESTGKPYWDSRYGEKFRIVRRKAGVPSYVWSMDTRAGAITETIDATHSIEAAQKLATHSNPKTTGRYNRGDGLNHNRAIAQTRSDMRK